MPELIDTLHLGRDRAIGAWWKDGVIIDPGPSTGLDAVLAGLGDREPEAILLTHIHLDHAGGTGSLVARFPDVRVYVHEVGAPHLVDPSRLLASAARLYGEQMERLWGEVLPIPEENVTALSGDETVEGLSVLYTPGHAGHHVSYLDDGNGDAFVGDVAGVRIPPGELTLMPTPPPEIDVELWLASIEALRERDPQRLHLTHFGAVDDAPAQLDAAAEQLRKQAELARDGGEDVFMQTLSEAIDSQDADAAERMRQVMPLDQVWSGLERYWRKRADG